MDELQRPLSLGQNGHLTILRKPQNLCPRLLGLLL